MDRSTLITYEKVRQDANIIKECSKVMRNIFDDFNSTMNQVGADDVFLGNASETLKSSFNSLKGRFDSYTATIEKFSNMIASAAQSTEQTEKNIAAAAEDLAR